MAVIRERFNEGSSGYIRAQIVDSNGDPVPFSDLTVATLTLYDIQTLEIINGRNEQDILAAGLSPAEKNNVVYEDDGYFTWHLQPGLEGSSPEDQGDNRKVTPRRQIERHQPLFHFEFPGGAFNYGKGNIEIEVMGKRS